jgi:hypothetical protein
MKRLWIVAFALVAMLPACKKTVTAPTGLTLPTQFVFTAQLLPANEVPAVTGAEAAGSGTVTITFNVTRDAAGTITAATSTFQVNLTGFPNGMNLTGAHIHNGPAGVVAGIVVSTGLANGELVVNGSASFTKSNVTMAADLTQSIITTPSGYYFNVHSTANGGGVSRGQLSLTSSK